MVPRSDGDNRECGATSLERQSRGCPRNCKRIAIRQPKPLGNREGRRMAETREPGDLPSREISRSGGASGRSDDGLLPIESDIVD